MESFSTLVLNFNFSSTLHRNETYYALNFFGKVKYKIKKNYKMEVCQQVCVDWCWNCINQAEIARRWMLCTKISYINMDSIPIKKEFSMHHHRICININNFRSTYIILLLFWQFWIFKTLTHASEQIHPILWNLKIVLVIRCACI